VNRWIPILAAASFGLGFAPAAHAQLDLSWVDPAASAADPMTQRLEDEARKMAKVNKDMAMKDVGQRTIAFDYVYPTVPTEYVALGGNGLLLISAVVRDPDELPFKHVYLRTGGKDVELMRISGRLSTVAPTSPLASTIGTNRDDEFFLLPGALAGRDVELIVDLKPNMRRYGVGRLSLALPNSLKVAVQGQPGPPDQAALKAVLAREYPNLVKR
jgi:hypothetical protein